MSARAASKSGAAVQAVGCSMTKEDGVGPRVTWESQGPKDDRSLMNSLVIWGMALVARGLVRPRQVS